MISIKNVNKSFGNHHVLTDIDLEVPKSNVVALIGPSGAGKSTLIRTINALEEIDKGEIVVDGISIHDKKRILTKLARTSASYSKALTYIRSYQHLKMSQSPQLK